MSGAVTFLPAAGARLLGLLYMKCLAVAAGVVVAGLSLRAPVDALPIM
jgi:hypothetical protein